MENFIFCAVLSASSCTLSAAQYYIWSPETALMVEEWGIHETDEEYIWVGSSIQTKRKQNASNREDSEQ